MYYSRSRSPASFAEGRSYNSIGKGTSYNYSTDFSLSSLNPRNPSIQRVMNADYGLSEYSRSPLTDYSNPVSRLTSLRSLPTSFSGEASPTFRRRDQSSSRALNDRSSPVSLRSEDLGYSSKSRNYFDYSSSASSLFTSYTPLIKHIKKPQRTDYTDYLRPVLTARPMLKSGYTPRSRDEREDNSIPLVRERKLIKFREISSNILSKVKRKMSWDLPEEISSPLIDENKQSNSEVGNMVSEQKRNRECNLNRRGSQDILSSTPGTSPMSGSPRPSVSRRSSDDQSLDKLSRIRRQSPMNNNSAISRESIYSSFDLKPEDLSINQYGKAPVPPPRKKSLGSNEKNKKSRKSSIEMLLSQEKSSNFSKIANEIRRNREAESSDVSNEGPLYEKRVSQDATVPTASVANTIDTILSSTVSEPIAVNESMDTDNGRGRRQRRRTLPEQETEPSETRSRHRSRFRSQLCNEVSDQSTSIVSNKVSEVFSPNETPYPTSRMHRKSVKYKDGLLPRRRSKCPEVVPESVVDSIPISLGTTVESKESKTEEKKKPDFNKLTKRETLPNVTASHKINTQNKMKHQEVELISDTMPKSKLEFPSDKVKISENTLNLENKMLNSAETVSNDKYTPQTKSKSKFKSPVVSSHIINEIDKKTSDKLTNIKTLEIEALEQNSKNETKIVAKSSFNNITSKNGIGQTEAKPTLAKIVNESEIKLIDENNSYKIGIKEEMTDKKLPQGGTLNKNKESDGKKLNKSKLNSSDSKVLLDAKSKIESKATTVANSTTDNSTITKIKVTGTQTSKKLKINSENTNEDKLNKTSSIITEDANIKSSSADSDINVSLCKVSKIEDKVKQNMNSVTGFKTNTDDKGDAKTFHQSKLKEDNCLKNEVSKIKDTDVKSLSVNSNSDMDRSILSNKTLEPKAEKLVAITNSAFDNSIRTEIKERDLNFCEKSKLDAKRINEEKDAKNEDSKLSTKAINVNNFSRLNSKPEIDKDSKVLHKKSKTEAKVIADTKSVIENNTKAASKGTDTKYSDILESNKDNSVESKVSNIKKSNVENKMLLDTNYKAKSQITSDSNSTSCNDTKIKVKETDNKNFDKSELNEDNSLKCEVSKNKDSDLKNKMLLDLNSKSETKITSTKNFNKDSTADNLLRVKTKELDSKVPTDNITTKFPDIKQLKNSNIKIDAKKSALKETSNISMKSVEKQELEKHTENFQPQKTTPASKVQEKVAQRKEFEEIVVVCKLPPPKLVCKLPPPEAETMNQNIPSVVVSIKNPALKTANSDVVKDNLTIIPSKESFSNDKLESCDTLKKHCNAEETEVKVVHTVVLKPKIQKKYLENKNVPNSQKAEKEVGTHDKLKAIPDVIKSTIRIDSKSDREISDIVKGTLNKENGQVNANKIISDARNDNLDENCGKSLTNRKTSLAKELSDLNKELVTKEKSKVEPQSPNESKNTLNNSNEVAAKDVQRENVQKSKPAKINGSDEKKSITPDLIQMTTKATEKISEKLLPNISKDSFVEKPIPDKNIFKIQKDEPGKTISESKNELKRSAVDTNSHEKSKVDPISYEEKFENAISFYKPKHRYIENTQNNAAGNKNAFKTGLPDLKTLESEKQDIRKIELDNRNDKVSSVMSFDKNKIKIPDRNSLTSKANENLNSTSIVNHATEANLKSKDINDEKNKIILPQIEEVGKRDAENSKNTSKGSLIFNQNKVNKGKDTTYPYKKSVTVPNIANLLLENNYTEVNKHSLSNTEKIKKTELASLSTGNVPITLQEGKSFAKIADKKTGKDKSETMNSVPKLTGGEKMDKENLISTSEIKKEILTDIPPKNSSKEKDLKNFPCSKTLTNTLSEPEISPDKIPVADKSGSSSVIKEMPKSIPILEEKIHSLTESKISSKIADKQVLKQTDIKIEFKEPRTQLKVEEKTEPHLDNFHNSAENSKDVSAVNINPALDTITKIRENNSVIDIGLNKQNTPEFFKLPSINDDTQPNGLAQKIDKFIEKDSFSMPTHINSGVNLLSCVESVIKKDTFQKEKEVSKVNVDTNDEKAIIKDSMSLSSDKSLLISEKTLDSETLSLSKDDITGQKECAPVTQKPDLNEVKITNSQTPKPNKPKVPKLPPVPPPYGRIGLFLRPKDPPQTILESSSSESESETETETETSEDESALAVKKCSTLTNGKSPDRDEKCRSRSETSNASIYSNLSNSTTYTTYSTSSIDDEYDRSPIKPKEKLKQLRFRKYEVDDFVFLKLLGKGSFGKVLLAELKDSEMYFAIKCLKKDVVLEDDDVESTMIERRVLALGTQHPYMCKLYCTFQTKSYLFFVMEYLNGGDLMFHIQESRPFKEDRAMFYAAEIVSALKFLHKRGIVYRDIKLDNVMLDEQGHVRLVDFGMCQCRIYMEECMPSNFCGTPSYIAPEIVLGQKYNQSVDWWSFGILLYEMLSGRSPFHGTDEDELFWSICNEEPHYPRFLSREAINIVGLLLQKSPSKRLGMPTCSAGDIKDHAFFSSINWDKIEKKQVPPPFRPSVSGPSDTSNFDSSFTMDSASLSPVENEVLESMDQQQFHGFSYTNPHITD